MSLDYKMAPSPNTGAITPGNDVLPDISAIWTTEDTTVTIENKNGVSQSYLCLAGIQYPVDPYKVTAADPAGDVGVIFPII